MAAKPEPQPADPFDIPSLRAAHVQDLGLEHVVTTVPVRKPKPNEFFRVHPDDEYALNVRVLEHQNNLDRTTYWVVPGLYDELADQMKPVCIFTCITKGKNVFLWPAKLPVEGNNTGRAWHASAMEAAEQAKTLWVKLVSNKELGCYEYKVARGDLGDPQLPDKPFKELLKLAFKDQLIEALDHAVIRELYGDS